MQNIIVSKPSNEDAKKDVFLVKWEGFTHKEITWKSFQNVNENARQLMEEYH